MRNIYHPFIVGLIVLLSPFSSFAVCVQGSITSDTISHSLGAVPDYVTFHAVGTPNGTHGVYSSGWYNGTNQAMIELSVQSGGNHKNYTSSSAVLGQHNPFNNSGSNVSVSSMTSSSIVLSGWPFNGGWYEACVSDSGGSGTSTIEVGSQAQQNTFYGFMIFFISMYLVIYVLKRR